MVPLFDIIQYPDYIGVFEHYTTITVAKHTLRSLTFDSYPCKPSLKYSRINVEKVQSCIECVMGQQFSMVFNGFQWFSMVFNGFRQFYIISWPANVISRWFSMAVDGFQWFSMVL